MVSLLLWVMPRHETRRLAVIGPATACLAMMAAAGPAAAEAPPAAARLGAAMVPHDAAFLSSSLRVREQYDALVKSNAFKSVLALPAVRRAFDSLEEQRSTPGSPLSTVDAFLQLPDNADAVSLLADMVATDTFVYGEPSCVSFWKLLRTLGQAQQQPGEALDGAAQARAILAALADHRDLLVVPDVVWGFRTTQRDVAIDQIGRLEQVATMMLQADPILARSVGRRKVAGSDFLTLTIEGDQVPWSDVEGAAVEATGDASSVEKVIGSLKDLDLVLAIGVVGDWVIVSLGDSVDHLDKLATPESSRTGLLTLPAFAPLLEHADRRLTGISYLSESLCEAASSSRSDMDPLLGAVDQLMDDFSATPAEAKAEFRSLGEAAIDEWAKRLPDPGPWMAYSFMTDQGYEGSIWNWARNQPFDGSKRLDLLEHAGGAPLGVMVTRMKSDPAAFDVMIDLIGRAWKFVGTHVRGMINPVEPFDAFAEHVAPLGGRFAAILRDKIGRSLADGQIGVVLDAKGRTKRLQGELPPSAEPLPLVEPAVVLPLADPKLFREGLSDLFALGDDLTDALKQMDPGTVPEGYRIPEPEKSKTDDGSVWSWKLVNSRLDDQIRPAIGVGERAAVFSIAPKQAGRLLVESRLETGAQLATFDEPLVGAAAFDFAGMIDAIEPWVVYLTRYGCVQERDGVVDPAVELTAADETEQAREVLEHAKVVLAALKSLRAGVAETSFQEDALVTRWRNVIRDLPAK